MALAQTLQQLTNIANADKKIYEFINKEGCKASHNGKEYITFKTYDLNMNYFTTLELISHIKTVCDQHDLDFMLIKDEAEGRAFQAEKP